jgi:FtsH-binding integral membrane protein
MWLDPSIIFSALSGSAVIFLSLTVTAMMTPRRSQLYLGGLLAAATSGLLWLSLINGFAHSASLFNAEIYIGLLVFAGYVLFDTQLIVENSEEGRRDTVGDALELFTNLFAIFVRILVLLSQDRQRKRRRTKDDDD